MAEAERGAQRRGGMGAGARMRLVPVARMAAAALCLLAAACTAIYRNHGYVPTEDELALVEVGRDTRESVAEKIGRPSAEGLLNDQGWFYVQSRFKTVGPREPQEIERQVLAVTFSEGGTVENIARYGLEDGRVIEISRRVTETNVKGIGFIRQLLSNFGRIRLDQLGGG
jgi:outer membrane protein assembly factor BamE (lipoprotein component of BamABCDE complex)